MKKLDRIFNMIISLFEILAVICLVCMVLLVFINAMARYLFKTGFNSSEELSRFFFIILTFLGTLIAHHRWDHISMPLLLDKLHGKLHTAVNALGRVIVTALFAYILYSSWKYTAQTMGYLTTSTRIPFGLVTMWMPISAALIVLSDLIKFIGVVAGVVQDKRKQGEI